MQIQKSVRTPCIGVCSTGIGDVVCRGCKRFTHEIIQWNGYSEHQKRAILKRLHQLLAQVVRARISVVNEALLRTRCAHFGVVIQDEANSHCWVFDLLKAGASQIDQLSGFGCAVNPLYAHMSMTQLRDDIDKDFFILSEVHYERYFHTDMVQPAAE